MRRPALLAALLGAAALLVRRRARVGQADRDVWTQATEAPDLR
jgi:hypothetical protein